MPEILAGRQSGAAACGAGSGGVLRRALMPRRCLQEHPAPSYSASESEERVEEVAKPAVGRDQEDDAATLLLGLSQHGADGADDGAGSSRAGARPAPKRPLPQAAPSPRDFPHLTAKGEQRMGPGDNRVRPPKAATKLLPEAKWRHIRLPDVESALEGEDWVVMWAQYKHPGEPPPPPSPSVCVHRPFLFVSCGVTCLPGLTPAPPCLQTPSPAPRPRAC